MFENFRAKDGVETFRVHGNGVRRARKIHLPALGVKITGGDVFKMTEVGAIRLLTTADINHFPAQSWRESGEAIRN